jgi:cobalt-zinc-cadmium efflux system membrane fusion protein
MNQIWRAVPTVAVLTALAAIGYGGHHTGWKIPRFSQLTGHTEQRLEDWCAEHGVPESICVACNAELMPKRKLEGWCKAHGVAECVLDHAELAQLKQLPEAAEADLDRARRALAIRPRAKNDPACKLHLRRIQFASADAADKAGIDIAITDRAAIVETVAANGQVVYDATRVARLSSRAAGAVWRVEKNVGDAVREGEVLAIVDAAEVGRAKAELLQAAAQLALRTRTHERLANLASGIVEQRRVQEAETDRAEAEIAVHKAIHTLGTLGLEITFEEVEGKSRAEVARHVQVLGLPPEITQDFDTVRTTANLIPVVAPRDGLVAIRNVVRGEVIDTTITLFTIVDTSQMWLLLDVPVEDARYLAQGQKVVFRPDGETTEHTGTITWISTDIDAQTRTVKVRAELANPDGRLRSEWFGAAQVVLREEQESIVAPKQAIHWEGCCYVAFVRDKDYLKEGSYKVFHTRMVRPGVTNGDITEVIAGLLPGEVLVAKGSAVLRAELLKGNLGAG